MKKYIIVFLFLLFSQIKIFSQGYPLIESDIDTKLSISTQSWSIVQDKNGFIYIANTSGIVYFNGNKWNLLKLPNQQTVRFLQLANNDTIYVGGQNELGYLNFDKNGALNYESLVSLVPKKYRSFEDVWEVFRTDSQFVLRTTKAVFFKDEKTDSFNVVESAGRLDRSFFVNNNFFVKQDKVGFVKLENGKLVLQNGGEFYSDKMIMNIFPLQNKIRIITARSGIFDYDSLTGISEKKVFSDTLTRYLKDKYIYRFIPLKKGGYAIGSNRNGLAIVDSSFTNILQISEDQGLSDNLVIDLFEDMHGNIWSINGNNFSILFNSSNWKKLYSLNGLEGAVYNSIFYKNELIIGGSNGLFKLENGRIKRLNKIMRQVWSFFPTGEELLISYRNGLLVKNEDLYFTNLSDNMWSVIDYLENEKKLYVGTYSSGIVQLSKESGKWEYNKSIEAYDESVRFSVLDSNGYLWITQPSRGVDRLEINFSTDSLLNIRNFGIKNGLPKSENNYVFQIKNKGKNELVFATMEGIYLYDYNNDTIIKHPDFESTISNYETDLFVQDSVGNIWFQSFKNDFYYKGYLNLRNGSYQLIDTPFFKLKDIYVESYTFGSHVVVLNSSEGLFFYSPDSNRIVNKDYSAKISAFFVNDSLFYSSPGICPASFKLQANPESIKLYYGALFFEDNEKIEYRYKLEGFDKEWSDWTQLKYKEYTNLSKGNYTFKLEAKNCYETISKQATLNFSIQASFFESYIAYSLYFILLIVFIILIVKLYTYKLKQDKKRLERIVDERTQEISQQKEELLVIAENLKEANTSILSKNEELKVANTQIAMRNKKITDSINYALTIQSAMLPQSSIFENYFSDFFILFQPKDIVSGDFYWTRKFGSKVVVVAADCTGHGVPGGFMSMLGIAFLNEIIISDNNLSPKMILENLREKVKGVFAHRNSPKEHANGMDLSIIIYDKENFKIQFAGANNGCVLIKSDSKEVVKIEADRQPIGNYRREFDFTEQEFIMSSGDWLYMFSDGFHDQLGEIAKTRYKSGPFIKLLQKNSIEKANRQKEILASEFELWKGKFSQVDDVLVIGLEI